MFGSSSCPPPVPPPMSRSFFFWIGAFCVLVVVLGLCSCYVVTPLFRWYRARHAPASDPTADIEGKGRTKKVGGYILIDELVVLSHLMLHQLKRCTYDDRGRRVSQGGVCSCVISTLRCTAPSTSIVRPDSSLYWAVQALRS